MKHKGLVNLTALYTARDREDDLGLKGHCDPKKEYIVEIGTHQQIWKQSNLQD